MCSLFGTVFTGLVAQGRFYLKTTIGVVIEYIWGGANRLPPKENEFLAQEIAEVLDDSHSLGAFRVIVDKIPKQQIRIFLSIIKDTYLTGRIKNSRGAMFITLAKDYARDNNINLNFK